MGGFRLDLRNVMHNVPMDGPAGNSGAFATP